MPGPCDGADNGGCADGSTCLTSVDDGSVVACLCPDGDVVLVGEECRESSLHSIAEYVISPYPEAPRIT